MGIIEDPPVFLLRRENGMLYFRRPIPKNLQPFLNSGNKREITISLKSKKLTAHTRKLHHEFLLESERLLEEAEERAKAFAVPQMPNGPEDLQTQSDSLRQRSLLDFTESELRLMIAGWMASEEGRAIEHCRFLAAFGSQKDRLQAKDDVNAKLKDLLSNGIELHRVKREILAKVGAEMPWPFSASSLDISAMFSGLIREGLILIHQGMLTYLETGNWPIRAASQLPPVPLVPRSSNTVSTEPSVSLDTLISQFEKDPRRQDIMPKTRDECHLVFRILLEMIGGQTPIASIQRDQLREIQSVCLALPAHYARIYPGKGLREVAVLAKKDNKPPMNPNTFNKRMTIVASVFEYALREQMITGNPARGLTVKGETSLPGAKSFTISQLQRIFSGRLFQFFGEFKNARFSPGDKSNPHEFWAPLIALFQGMRQEEILQLGPQDVEEFDGIQCLKIGLREGLRVKTKQSKRIVPIHPELKCLGFLQYVAAARKDKLKDLFPDAAPGKTYGNRSHNYSKKFNRYLLEIGLKSSRDQCFHSFRHTFSDGLATAGISGRTKNLLGGWTDRMSIADTYGGKVSAFLAGELAKLQYEGLDLSHLRPDTV